MNPFFESSFPLTFGQGQKIIGCMAIEDKRYSDKEVRTIIDYAMRAERQLQPGQIPSEGLTPAEIESVGLGVGIRPEQIRWAINELETRHSARISRALLGNPVLCSYVETLDLTLSAEAVKDSLVEIRSVSSGCEVDLSAEGERLRLRVIDRLYPFAGGLFGGLIGGLGLGVGLGVGIGVGVGVLGSPLFAALVPIGCIAAGYVLARSIFGRIFRSKRLRLLSFVGQIRSILAARQ